VPDSGLASTGVAKPVTTWVNANTPTQSTSNGQTTVTVVQTAQQALLNWQTFNIGKDTTLDFDQSAGGANVSQWVAINKVAKSLPPRFSVRSGARPGLRHQPERHIFAVLPRSMWARWLPLPCRSMTIWSNAASSQPRRSIPVFAIDILAKQVRHRLSLRRKILPLRLPVRCRNGSSGNLNLVTATGGMEMSWCRRSANLQSRHRRNVRGKVALIGPNVANAAQFPLPTARPSLLRKPDRIRRA